MRYLKEVSKNPLNLEPIRTIQPQNWIKKKVSDFLYILIPKKYITSRTNYNECKNAPKKKNYTSEEYTIGIAFEGKESISDEDFMSPTYHKKNTDYPKKIEVDTIGSLDVEIYVPWLSSHVIEHLTDIFISYNDYNNSKTIPCSAILLFGHGAKYVSLDDRISLLQYLKPNLPKDEIESEVKKLEKFKEQGKKIYSAGIISGLRKNDFGSLVKYLDNTIQVSLLFTRSCYGSEINLESALKEIVSAEQKSAISPSFILISGTISSAIGVGGYKLEIIHVNERKERSLLIPCYKQFFDELIRDIQPLDKRLFDALQNVYLFYKKYKSYNNIPSIKYPGQPWRPLDIPKIIVTLDDIMLKNAHDRLDISSFFKEKKAPIITESFEPPPISEFLSHKLPYPNVLFIKQAKIPFELVVSGTSKIDLPAFISNIPGDAVHHFAKIDASTYELSRFLEAFFTIYDLHDNKTFIIDELRVKNDLTILPYDLGKELTLHNVILQNTVITYSDSSPKKSVFFQTPDGKEWAAENITMDNPIGFAITEKIKKE